MQLDQRLDRVGIDFALLVRLGLDPVAQVMRAEILDQHQPALGLLGIDLRRSQSVLHQPFADMNERTRILVGRRSVHQHGAFAQTANAKISAEAGIAGQRLDHGLAPACRLQEIVDAVRQVVAHRQRSSQSAPGSAIALRPFPTDSR